MFVCEYQYQGGRLEDDLAIYLKNETTSFDLVNLSEYILANFKNIDTQKFLTGLRKAHLNRANKNARHGKAAILALLHLERYVDLEGDMTLSEVSEIKKHIIRSISSSKEINVDIGIKVANTIEPIFSDISRMMLYRNIEGLTKGRFKWNWHAFPYRDVKVKVDFGKLIYYRTSLDDLSMTNSHYLSHFEDIPNPAKAFYESQLNFSEIQVNSAESQYNWAVNSHNSYPTQHSLQNVNNAKNRYSIAINNYNHLVNMYNMTPATISRPVNLPYNFQQGTIRHGWDIYVEYFIDDKIFIFNKKLVDSDFVRIGAKYNDTNQNYRNNDLLDIDISFENGLSKLDSIITDLCHDIGMSLCKLQYSGIATGIGGYEEDILSVCYHPFGFSYAKNCHEVDNWIEKTMANTKIPEINLLPHTIKLTPPQT